jgi:hypothetical protein
MLPIVSMIVCLSVFVCAITIPTPVKIKITKKAVFIVVSLPLFIFEKCFALDDLTLRDSKTRVVMNFKAGMTNFKELREFICRGIVAAFGE